MLAAVYALLPAAASAAAYPRLHITALGQHAERSSVAPHEAFHVTIRVHVSERVDRFVDELVLGDLENCTITGDERVRTLVADGTTFTERLTLEARAPGTASISPAHIDAIDPVSGKALRYSSNAVEVRVTGATPDIDRTYRTFVTALRWVLAGAGVLAAAFVLFALFALRRRRAPQAARASPAAGPAVAVRTEATPGERLKLAAADFRAQRDLHTLAALRALLLERAGVPRGATLVDALRALGPEDRSLRAALLASERALFGPAGERETAGKDLLAALEAYFGDPAPNAQAWTP
ncbi:MAG: hypothetical protein NVSMB64_18000 [Candidatus Velthaea sp.]